MMKLEFHIRSSKPCDRAIYDMGIDMAGGRWHETVEKCAFYGRTFFVCVDIEVQIQVVNI